VKTDFDAVVIGGGPVGATTAALLALQSGLAPERVALLAPELHAAALTSGTAGAADTTEVVDHTVPPELRVSALSRASERILHQAGAWNRMDLQRLCPYERMRVWHESAPADGPEVLVFDAAELAEANLGYIAENRAVSAAALASFRATGGTVVGDTLLGGTWLGEAARPECIELTTPRGSISTRLVVGADGARSRVREWLGVEISAHDYGQSAVVATVATERAHQGTAWQRFLGTGPLALLPLFDGSCSIVWSIEAPLARELMGLSADEFALRLDDACDRVLGRTRLLSERLAVPLQRATARRLYGRRAALLGDAAHVIHPLAGQGVNLGLLDAAALVEAVAVGISAGEDPGAGRLLRRYEQARYTQDALMSFGMSALGELFARGPGPRGWIAARLLGLAGISLGSRRWFARRALGLVGELPRLARAA